MAAISRDHVRKLARRSSLEKSANQVLSEGLWWLERGAFGLSLGALVAGAALYFFGRRGGNPKLAVALIGGICATWAVLAIVRALHGGAQARLDRRWKRQRQERASIAEKRLRW